MSGSVTYATMSSSVVVSNAAAVTSTVPTTSATEPDRATWTPKLLPGGQPSFQFGPPFGPEEIFWNATREWSGGIPYYNSSKLSNESVVTYLSSAPYVCNVTLGGGSRDADDVRTHECCQRTGGLYAAGYGCRLSTKLFDNHEMQLAFSTCSKNGTGGTQTRCEGFDWTYFRGFRHVEATTAWGNYSDQVNNATDGSGTVLCTALGGTGESIAHCCMDPERAAQDAAAAPDLHAPCAVKNNNKSLSDFRHCLLRQHAYAVCLPRSLPINAEIVHKPPKALVDSAAGPAADAKRGALAAAVVATLALASFVTM